jgi:hypothetical protein
MASSAITGGGARSLPGRTMRAATEQGWESDAGARASREKELGEADGQTTGAEPAGGQLWKI